jgi:hypothetical protein
MNPSIISIILEKSRRVEQYNHDKSSKKEITAAFTYNATMLILSNSEQPTSPMGGSLDYSLRGD